MKKNRIPSEADRRTIRAGRCYGALVLTVLACAALTCSALAADDPLTIVSNLSDFVFSIIKALGVQCVIAKSFARIFFRNSINNGLLLIEQPDLHDDIKEGDTVTVVMNEHVDYNGKQYPIASLPENLMSIIQAGGLVKAMRKLNGLD